MSEPDSTGVTAGHQPGQHPPEPGDDRCPRIKDLSTQIDELLLYASENGIDAEGKVIEPLNTALVEYKNAAVGEKLAKRGPLLKHYAGLVKLTAPVNGRTILETQYLSQPTLLRLLLVTLGILLLGVMNEGLAIWFAEHAEPEEGLSKLLFDLRNSVLEYLSPFIWGALGACVFLMKKQYDYAAARQFDSEMNRGWTLRLLLGAILGAIVAHIYDLALLGGEEGALDPDIFAFLTGVGVKVVYGAIERTVEGLAERMNIGAVRRARATPRDAVDVLTMKLSETDKDTDPERLRALQELVKELQAQR